MGLLKWHTNVNKTESAIFCPRLEMLSDGNHLLDDGEECHNFKENEYFKAKKTQQEFDMCIVSYHRGSREERSARSHLIEDASDAPHVDRGRVLR